MHGVAVVVESLTRDFWRKGRYLASTPTTNVYIMFVEARISLSETSLSNFDVGGNVKNQNFPNGLYSTLHVPLAYLFVVVKFKYSGDLR